MQPKMLETHVNWRAKDVRNADEWTVPLTPHDHRELDSALKVATAKSSDLLHIGKEDFPLDELAGKLCDIERELIDGRGFVRIAALDTSRYSDEELTMLYWGIGTHLGNAWPQNKQGHVMGDVTNQGRAPDDPEARGNELGAVRLDYHTDGSDLVGLMCLRAAKSGGLSCVANAVAIHNVLVSDRPDLAAALYDQVPWDFRGQEPPGGPKYYMQSVFTEHDDRLFVRFVPQYIRSSQRHADAPRLSASFVEAAQAASDLANDPDFNVVMDLRPGEIQFINNYHVLHARTAYEDDEAAGFKRHLKRLWLASRYLTSRPPSIERKVRSHWNKQRSISNIPPLGAPLRT